MIQTLEPILAEIPLFRGMEQEYVALLAGCAANVRLEPGQFLFRIGDDADGFWLVRQGQVSVEIHAPGRGALTIHTARDGDVIGWSWLVPPYQRHFDARAIVATRALRMDAKCLRDKFESDPRLGYELMSRFGRVVTQRLDSMALQLLDVYGHRANPTS